MSSPVTVSLQIPYVESEREFVMLAVQIAVRTFRSMNTASIDPLPPPLSTSTDPSNDSSPQTQEALNEQKFRSPSMGLRPVPALPTRGNG
jgi:hypothetical protein